MKAPLKLLTFLMCSTCFAIQEDEDFTIPSLETLPHQTIAEKKQCFLSTDLANDLNQKDQEKLQAVNQMLSEKYRYLKELFERTYSLSCEERANPLVHQTLKSEIAKKRAEIKEIQKQWAKNAPFMEESESYALWHQPDSTLLQIVIDYGDPSHLYIVPPEIGCIPCSLTSNFPIPREAWGECLELVLQQYGICVQELSPFVKELHFMSSDLSKLTSITNNPKDLDVLPDRARICFILSPEDADPRPAFQLLQKFSNISTTDIEILSGKVFLTGTVEEIKELLKLYHFAGLEGAQQDAQIIQLNKIPAQEMEKMLLSSFHGGAESFDGSSLQILSMDHLSNVLFLTGPKDEVSRARTIIQDLEAQVEDPREKTVFWYTAKHSDPEELATVLARVYDMLTNQESGSVSIKKTDLSAEEKGSISPKKIEPQASKSHKTADGRNNFIVDAKTGALIMVVEQESLPKIKELLKRLDVPKKMVQLEVLLFERKLSNQNRCGLNLLRLGSQALNASTAAASWNTPEIGTGILEFFFSRRQGSGIPAYDAAYQFLLAQEDVQINASPSITTMNQTPATIAVVEEISVDSGANDKQAHMYSRAQYGIVIEITPTINVDEEMELTEGGFVTLDTDITFDTTKKNTNDRPDVTRRHIKNHVRIADGETVILGGLRRKSTHDKKDSIPFLGEIPGIGKLFSMSEGNDSNSEMFVFITPKIINDPIKDQEALKRQQLRKRPGDVPEFFHELVIAKDKQRKRLFEGTLKTLFGPHEGITTPYCYQEYDGRTS